MIAMAEIWKDIPGYEGLYQASSDGRVKALKKTWYSGKNHSVVKTKEEHIIKPNISKCGYWKLTLMKNSVPQYVRKSRIVALAFIYNPENKPQVNHINGNKLIDAVWNLEWSTGSENILHAVRTGLKVPTHHSQGEASPSAKLTDEKVRQIKSSSLSGRKLGKIYQVHHSIIDGIRNGKRWAHVQCF